MRRLFKRYSKLGAFKVGACTTVLGSTIFASKSDISDITRPILFWNKMFPIYLSYKFNEWYDNNNPENWESIHQQYAPQVLATILELKGIYIKIGQVMSQRPDMAPEVYRQAFQVLLDGVQGLSGQDARYIVERNLGVPIESVFSYFNDIPIGAASIAQAHYAVLLDGREVVVKVQHPNAFEEFKSDIKTVNTFVRLAQPEQELILDEFEQQFLMEFDFEREAWALETIHNNIANDFPDVIIPRPIPGLVKKNIMVMDFVPGVKLIDAVIKQAEETANGFGMTLQELQHLSYNPTWVFKAKYFGYKAFQKLYYLKTFLYNSVVPLLGVFKFKLEPIQYPLNIVKLYDQLLQVHGKQLLIDGIFNADPHRKSFLTSR
jgi:aarF domain-containing kinase